MKRKPRYSILQVTLAVTACSIVLFAASLIAVLLSPAEANLKTTTAAGRGSFLREIIFIAVSIAYFYFTVNRYYFLLAERKKFIHYAGTTLAGSAIIVGYYCVRYAVFDPKTLKMFSTGLIIYSCAVVLICFSGISLLAAYLTSLRDEQKQRKVLEQQKMQLEVEKSQANLNFLKAQINPHFLYNTLNFLYAKSLPYSAELSECILTLSDIMRYSLNEGSKGEQAFLKDEIEHVQNVIRINQFRFSNQLNVRFDVTGDVEGITIIPFVLITLVENAFKHGDLKSSEDPITIRLNISESGLYFYCRNKKKSGPKDPSTGIGLDNIRKRLQLAYGDRYLFNVQEDAEQYITELTIHSL